MLLAFLVLSLLATPMIAQAAEPVQLQTMGPARLYAYAHLEDGLVIVRFSGVFKLAVEIDGQAGLEVDPPAAWTTSDGWKVKDVETPTVTRQGDRRRWRQTFVLDPQTPAAATFELKPLRYRNGTGPWATVAWKPVAVKIIAQMTEKDLKNLRENPAIEELPSAAPTGYRWGWLAAAVAAVLVLVLVVVLLRRRGVRQSHSRTPEEIALYELERLETLKLPERGRAGEFHTLLANVLRRYLEKRHQLPARRLTTQEFCVLLEQTPLLSAGQKEFVRTFLERCDLAKFAAASVSAEQCAELCRQTRHFLSANGVPH